MTLRSRQIWPADLLRQVQAQAAPSKLPPKLLSWAGANAYLRWNETRARGRALESGEQGFSC